MPIASPSAAIVQVAIYRQLPVWVCEVKPFNLPGVLRVFDLNEL